MKTKFNECFKHGVYFKSENDISTEYLIQVCKGKTDGNALVKIYAATNSFENIFNVNELINGFTVFGFSESDITLVAEVDLWGKYFFPRFNNELQLYYDEEKYYKGDYKTNSITSLMDAINFAIEYGLEKSGIFPY